MKKTLIVVAHPHIENSVVNKCWIERLRQIPDQCMVHELYKVYPNGDIDVAKEQALIEQHESLILQFPVYWFNCTPLLKQWLDDVFTYGWAYGLAGDKLKNKKVALAVSAGMRKDDWMTNGHNKFTLEDALRSFEITMNYVKADYQPFFAFYGVESDSSMQRVRQSAELYVDYLTAFQAK